MPNADHGWFWDICSQRNAWMPMNPLAASADAAAPAWMPARPMRSANLSWWMPITAWLITQLKTDQRRCPSRSPQPWGHGSRGVTFARRSARGTTAPCPAATIPTSTRPWLLDLKKEDVLNWDDASWDERLRGPPCVESNPGCGVGMRFQPLIRPLAFEDRFHAMNRHRRIVAAVIAAGTLTWAGPARALVPYVYIPTQDERRGSSIGIGRTAAQLLQLGQPREAAQLAALAVRLQPDDERLWSVLAEAQLRSNQLPDASRSLARAKKLNPDKASLVRKPPSPCARNARVMRSTCSTAAFSSTPPTLRLFRWATRICRTGCLARCPAGTSLRKASGRPSTTWPRSLRDGDATSDPTWRRVLALKTTRTHACPCGDHRRRHTRRAPSPRRPNAINYIRFIG